MRSTEVTNILIVGLIFVLVTGCAIQSEKKTRERPNILFCLADDVSYPHMGAYGCDWLKTPNFDRVADQGLLFTNAYTPNAKCAPSRAAILTGRNSWQLKEAANHFCYFPEEFKTYAEVLSENDYFVGSTGKKWAPGDPGTIDGKKRRLAGKGWDAKKLTPPTTEVSTNDYAANFKDFLDQKPSNQPFCFWYGSLEPHRAYEFESSMKAGDWFKNQTPQIPPFWPESDSVRTDMMDYALELYHFDKHLGQMLDHLEATGMLDNTLVVVTADNGMPFPRVKGQVYEFSNHLPLAVMWGKGIKNPGKIIEDYVSFIDFAPTFLELANVDVDESGMKPVTGKSLAPLFAADLSESRVPHREYVLLGKERHDIGRPDDVGYPVRGIVKDGFLYLKNFKTDRWPAGNPETGYPNVDASPTKTQVLKTLFIPEQKYYWEWSFGKREEEELYNIEEDPYCINNLIGDGAFDSKHKELQVLLVSELRKQNDPRVLGEGHVFDEYPYAGKDKDYYNRRKNGEDIEAGWLNKSDRNYVPAD